MGRIVQSDIIDGATLNSSLSDGISVNRVFIVDELKGSQSEKLYRAIQVAGVPRVGEVHPTIRRLRCDNVTAEALPASPDKAMVVASYKTLKFGESPPDEESQTQIQLGSTVQTVQTNKFFDGATQKIIKLEYEYPKGDAPDGAKNPSKQVGLVDKQIPLTTANFSRQEKQNPLRKSQRYVGTVNSTTFFGGKARTWLCTRLDGSSSDGGESYTVNYEFMYNPDTWDPFVVFIDPRTGQPPEGIADKAGNITQASAAKTVKIYKSRSFNALRLGVV